MKIKLYGTAAAEGIPALFCNCEVCLNASKVGGKEIRTRSQSLINDAILIDFPGDTFLHKAYHGLPLSDLEHLIITHSHHDHFFGEDLMMRMTGYSNHLKGVMNVYGNEVVQGMFDRAQNLEGFTDEDHLKFHLVNELDQIEIEDVIITPLLADHALNEKCFILDIKQGDKRILYGHDTGRFPDSVWEYFKEQDLVYNLVLLDCTHQKVRVQRNHMSFYDAIEMKERMMNEHFADEKTEFVLTHFSHNGGCTHEETVQWADENGFICAYDGIEFNI